MWINIGKLTWSKVVKLATDENIRNGKKRLFGDGGGLYFQAGNGCGASWLFRYNEPNTKRPRYIWALGRSIPSIWTWRGKRRANAASC
jgi:hypothetical protein